MKILQISPKIPVPADDGHKKSIFGVTKYLFLRGHKMDLVAYRQDWNGEGEIELRKYCNLHILDVKTNNSLPGAFCNLFSPVPYNLDKYRTGELSNFLKKYLSENEVDIIQVTNSHMGWVIELVKSIQNLPVVLRSENLEMMIMKRYYEEQKNLLLKFYSGLQYKKFIKYEPGLMTKFDKCIMISPVDEKNIKVINNQVNTITIPVGVESELLNYEKSDLEKYSIAHLGSMHWYPNYDGLMWFINDILPLVVQKIPQTKLYIYGSKFPESFSIPGTVKDNIVVKGFVNNIWDELKDIELCVVPLRIGGGLRVKILEMLATGQTIITTQIGAEGIGAEDGKHLFIENEPEKFASKIWEIFQNDDHILAMSKDGKEFIKNNFTWETVARKFEHVYNQLLAK